MAFTFPFPNPSLSGFRMQIKAVMLPQQTPN